MGRLDQLDLTELDQLLLDLAELVRSAYRAWLAELLLAACTLIGTGLSPTAPALGTTREDDVDR